MGGRTGCGMVIKDGNSPNTLRIVHTHPLIMRLQYSHWIITATLIHHPSRSLALPSS